MVQVSLRGQAQALSILTLAPIGDTQLVDGLDQSIRNASFTTIISLSIQWVLHRVDVNRSQASNVPTSSGSSSEGSLTIRLVAGRCESNGSSSQREPLEPWLMAGGVPIKAPVQG